MALVSTPRGLLWPPTLELPSTNDNGTVDAAGEKFAMIGRLHINGRPAGAKTLSTGNIQWFNALSTFANAGTSLDIGIQGVAAGAGPIAQPDGTFTVKATLTGGGGALSSGVWNTTTMNSGSASLAHGDLIAVVWDMTARAGADSVILAAQRPSGVYNLSGGAGFPVTNAFVASAWQTSTALGANKIPNVLITFDDGTLGWIDYTIPVKTFGISDAFQDSTNPDERGMLFQVPWDCDIDALWMVGVIANANSDFTLKLYSDPTGTPALLASRTFPAEQTGVATISVLLMDALASKVSLSKNTNYGISCLATGTANIGVISSVLGDTAHRVAIDGATTLAKITRNNSAGAFTAESPAITMYQLGVRIASFHDSAGGAAGVLTNPGLRGGMQ